MSLRATRLLKFTFSLRSMLIAITLFAILVGTWIASAERQRRAVSKINSECTLKEIEFRIVYGDPWGFDGWIPASFAEGDWTHFWHKVEDLTLWGGSEEPEESEELSSDLVSAVSELRELRSIGLNYWSINTADFSQLENCRIRVLAFSDVTFLGESTVHLPLSIQEIYLSTCTNSQPIFEFLPELTQLRSFEIDRIPFTDKQLTLLSSLANLESIEIGSVLQCNPIITNRSMANIANLKKLRTLCIQTDCEGFGDGGIESISALTQLESLSVPSRNVSSKGYKMLSRCKHLKKMELWGCPKDESALEGISEIKSLEWIVFHNWSEPVSETILSYLVDLPNLEYVDNEDLEFSFKGIKRLFQLPNFKGVTAIAASLGNGDLKMMMGLDDAPWTEGTLNLMDMTDLSGELERLSKAIALRTLFIDCTSLEDSDFKTLGGLVGLDALNIYGAKIGENSLRHLAPLTKLNQLYASEVESNWEWFPNLEELSTLDVSGELLTPAGCVAICKLPKLGHLSICYGVITKEMMASLSSSTSLTSLSLYECKIKTDALLPLANCKSLTKVDLAGSCFEKNSGLGVLSSLEQLDLRGSWFTDADAECLIGFQHLTKLNLRGTSITEMVVNDAELDLNGTEFVFRSNRSQTYLELKGSYWTDGRLQSLLGNRYLQSITFDNTNCSSDGMRELLTSLPYLQIVRWKNQTLEPTVLSALSSSRHLRQLELENVVLSQMHVDAIASSQTLQKIAISPANRSTMLDWSPLVTLPALEDLWITDCKVEIEERWKLKKLFGDRLRIGP